MIIFQFRVDDSIMSREQCQQNQNIYLARMIVKFVFTSC